MALLLVVGTAIASADAYKIHSKPAGDAGANGKAGELKIIYEKLEAIDEDPIINSFLYDCMVEEEIDAAKIVVMNGRWFSAKEVNTFYVVRNDTLQQIDIRERYEDDDGSLWTFYPKIRQTKTALKVLQSREVTGYNLICLGILGVMVDRENVPEIAKIVDNSSWASSNLPDGAKTFLKACDGLNKGASRAKSSERQGPTERKEPQRKNPKAGKHESKSVGH